MSQVKKNGNFLYMIIQCPSCHSEFFVERKLLKKEGRKVRCSECSFSWFQKPHEISRQRPRFASLDLRSSMPNEGKGKNRKKHSGKKRSKKLLFLYVFIFFSLISMVAVILSIEDLYKMGNSFTEFLGGKEKKKIPIGSALQREKIEIVEEEVNGEKKLVIKARIKNIASYPYQLSHITLVFYNKEGCLTNCCEVGKITMRTAKSGKPLEIKPYTTYDLKYPLTQSIPEKAKAIVVKFGITASNGVVVA